MRSTSLIKLSAAIVVLGMTAPSIAAADQTPLAQAPAGKPEGAGKPSGGKPEKKLGQYSGFEGREAELGAAVSPAIMAASTSKEPQHDFTGRERDLGLAVGTVIKTLNHNMSYQHDMNDALVKMTLQHIQYAKRRGDLEAMVVEDVDAQRQQLERVKKLIDRTGDKDLALVAVFEQTTCFFQLVQETVRKPNSVTYKSPYGVVLEQTRRMGVHDLTEKEIHDVWTIPRMQQYAAILGVTLDVTPWQDDGMITVSVR